MKIKKIAFFIVLSTFVFLPFISSAQVSKNIDTTVPVTYQGDTTVPSIPSSGNSSVSAQLPPSAGVAPATAGNRIGTQANFINTNTSNATGSFLCPLANRPTLGVLFNYITCILTKSVVPLIFTLAIVLFIWGVIQYVINTEDEAKKKKGKSFMIWGIIALAVMTSVWGIVAVLGKTFGIDTPFVPQLQGTSNSSTPTDNTTAVPGSSLQGSLNPNNDVQLSN